MNQRISRVRSDEPSADDLLGLDIELQDDLADAGIISLFAGVQSLSRMKAQALNEALDTLISGYEAKIRAFREKIEQAEQDGENGFTLQEAIQLQYRLAQKYSSLLKIKKTDDVATKRILVVEQIKELEACLSETRRLLIELFGDQENDPNTLINPLDIDCGYGEGTEDFSEIDEEGEWKEA